MQGLGAAGTQLTADIFQQRQKLDQDLARTNAAVMFQTHETNVKSSKKDLDEQLQSGQIDQIAYVAALKDAQKQSFDSTIGALPDNHFKNIATIQAQGLDRTVTLGMQEVLTKNTQQLIAANAATLLDTAGKSIATNPGGIDATVTSTRSAYLSAAASAGIPKQRAEQVAQDWADSQYAAHAQSAAIAARGNGDLAALTQLEKDLTSPDGYYAGKLDAGKRNQVLASVVSNRLSLQNQMTSEQQAREREAVTAFNQATDLMTQGKRFSPEYVQQLTAATRGTALEQQTQGVIKQAAVGASFSTLSVPEMRAAVQANESKQNQSGTDPLEAAAIKQQKQILTATDEAYKRDPWNAALERGAIDVVPPIDTSGITQLASSLAARAQLAPVVEHKAARRVSLLTPDEARNVLQTIDALPTNTKAQALALLGRSMGNAARINDLAEQWKDKSPAAALAMKAGAADPSGGPLMMQSGMPVAQYILDGQDALANKLVKVDAAAATGLQATIAKRIGDALPPQQLGDARETAYFAAVASARKNGRDVPNSTDVETGINVATGGLAKTGGIDPRGDRYMAAKPWGWSDDDFDGGVKQASITNIENQPGGRPVDSVIANGTKIPIDQFMQQFASYRLQRVGIGGTYTVLTGARPVTDTTGAPLLIHLTKPVPKR
ncbi:hypothetical protein DB771_13250 [Burkholderia sp. AU29985]|nr:hypothetical protein EGY28_22830 [Burkholderia dolosa]ETP64865.1 hypothetical protein BDSB_05530 [Burkholderia dolosa PC543]PRE49226.1 hypothetical protein C6P87_14905 [Burkholderia sp. AU12872]PUA76355.1 hypothetical protein DB771_13250 [Burkholderia sp. AU29985]